MRLFVALILFSFCANILATEGQGQIKGKLVDTAGNPVEGAYIFVVDDMAHQNIIASIYSDEGGLFALEAPCGNRTMGISCLGYKLARLEICIKESDTLDVGEYTLEENAQELQTVIVKGRPVKVRTKADGFLVNVEDIAESSNNALDLLGRLPQIRVKGNELSVIGKETVLLRVNNVLQRVSADQLADVLRGYDASLISSVEVITSPPLKYDSDGTTAMIILHMDSKFNKYVGGNIGTELMKGAAYNGRYGVYGTGVFNNEKLFVDVTPSANHNYSYMKEHTMYVYDNGDYYLNHAPSRGESDYYGVYATVQYQYNKRGYVGFSGNINKRNTDSHFTSEEEILQERTRNGNDIDIDRPRMDATLYAEHAFSSLFKGWLETSYYNYKETTAQSFDGYYGAEQNPFMTYLSDQRLKVDGVTLANDYSLALGQDGKLNFDFGVKAHYASISNFRSNELTDYGTTYPEQYDRMKLDEMKLTPYASATYRPAERWYFRVGAQLASNYRRIEGQEIEKKHMNYTNFLPAFIASWTPNASNRLSFNISSGSTDPKFDQINPFVWRMNQNSYCKGNLGLKSESLYYYKLVYTYKGSLSVTGYINQKRHEIKSVSSLVDGSVYTVMENAQNSVEYGIRPTYYFDRLSWMEFSVDAYCGYGVSKGLIPEASKRTTSCLWGGNGYASFVFNKQRTFTGYVSCDFTGKQKTAVSTIDPMADFSAGLSLYLLDRKLGLSVAGLNLFSSSYKGTSTRNGYTIKFDNKYNYPTLYLSVTYKFNNVKDATPRHQKMLHSIEQRL